MIARELIEEMFDNLRATDGWSVEGALLWGYFFTDGDPAALRRAGDALSRQGYRLVDVFPGEKEDGTAPDLWWLHVERVERHSVDSLCERNAVLGAFAASQGLASYDGMDVGPAP